MRMYSLFDVKTKEHLPPFEAANDVSARRACIELLSRNPETNRFVRHREDYVLVRVGDFELDSGTFEQVPPTTITTLSALYDDLRAAERDA